MTSPRFGRLQGLRRSRTTSPEPGRGREETAAKQAQNPRRRFVAGLVKGRPHVKANLQAVAELRGETPEEAAEQIAVNLLRTVPRIVRNFRVDFDELDIAECGFDAGHPWLRTTSGRFFYDYPASSRDVLYYLLFRDQIPEQITVETFGLATNVIRRYLNGTNNVPDGSRVVVDAGCYIGFKPIAYADKVGPEGKVIAIEMMPDNYDLLCRNVEANDLFDRIVTVNSALSDRTGTVVARRLHKQAATIADADQLAGFGEDSEVQMDTLANVFDRTIPDRDVDFLNVQVNGNELAALEGLGSWAKRVKAFSVTSPYTRDGARLREQVIEWFKDHDIEVTTVGETYVWARNPD